MKTTSVPLVGSCPEWDGRIPDQRLSEFKILLNQVHQDILVSAVRGLIREQRTRIWHFRMFRPFVPLNYYAGNFRQPHPRMPCLEQDVEVGGVMGSPWQVTSTEVQSLFLRIAKDIVQAELDWEQLAPRDRVLRVGWLVANLVGSFIRIHPFLNGNGRISRLLWQWVLLRFGAPVQCMTFPRPAPPYGQLMADAMRGNDFPLALYAIAHLAQNPPKQIVPQ